MLISVSSLSFLDTVIFAGRKVEETYSQRHFWTLVKAHGRHNTGTLEGESRETECFCDARGREQVCGYCKQWNQAPTLGAPKG